MSYCYHPLKALKLNIPDQDKNLIKVLKGEYDPHEVCTVPDGEFIPLPCGRCIGCRLQYSRVWADRCMLEAQYHESNYFLTLTYDNEHLPKPLEREIDVYDEDDDLIGTRHEVSTVNPLVKRDLQLFIKRLRKYTGQKIRYFACGEYSPYPRLRPHYHIILFGLKLDDLIIHKKDLKNGFVYYISPTIDAAWYPESDNWKPPNDRSINGFHLLTDVSWDTCAYTARYIMKKQKGNTSKLYKELNIPPEFTLMSRKPGIARDFYEDHKNIITDPYYISTKEGHKVVRSNKYFDSLFDIDYPKELESIKEDRVRASLMNERLKEEQTTLSYQERLWSEEANKLASIRSLKRKEV